MDIGKEETEKALNEFVTNVIKKAKKNLSSQDINASKDLYNSFKGFTKVNPNSIETTIEAEDYLPFIDRGVKGVKSGKSLSGFKYTNKKPPVRFLQTWMKQKSGKFRQRNQRSIAFAIQNKIFNHGIKPTKFFTNPFEEEFSKLPEEIVIAYGLDIEKFMKLILETDADI